MDQEHPNDKDIDAIESGMAVETLRGDLGEADVSKPQVVAVERDQAGHVEKVIVKKGKIFQKELDIPISRVQNVEAPSKQESDGRITLNISEQELEAMTSPGAVQVQKAINEDDFLDDIGESIPTAEALRDHEELSHLSKSHQVQVEERKGQPNALLRLLGPGFLGGMAGNDSSAVTAYSIDGAQNGFGHLWLMLLSTPMYYFVMTTCARIGRVTQQGLAEVLREHYGRWVALFAALVLVVANIAMITADLVAVGSGCELITGISWVWFVVPVAVLLWYITVFRNFESLKKIFLVMSLAFIVYFVTAIMAKPDWQSILVHTFVPHIDLNFASVSSAVALLGATISPYNIFWQVQGEKEEIRTGPLNKKLHESALDVIVGVFSGNLIAYAIIIATAATLFVHHRSIATAADAALALTTVLGPFAKYLFAIGFIGAGLVAIPVLLAGSSYAISGTIGWPAGLSKRPWQNEGFYLILTIAMLISLGLALLHLDPIQLMFWANILSGVLSPILIIYLIIISRNQKLMRGKQVGLGTTIALVFTFLVMAIAAVLLFYGLATGQQA